jgi:chemotaxis protein methyltransferase CheR
MTDALEQLAELVQRHSGMVVGASRLPSLRAAIGRLHGDASTAQMLELTADPHDGPRAIEGLVEEMTVNETFFMRHRAELDAIPWVGLLSAARRSGRASLRVWSAGCASGEEAYSLAIGALEALPGEMAPVSVLGTDISRRCLARASDGQYGARSLRLVTPELADRYFRATGTRRAEVGPELRLHVRVAHHNLARDPIPPAGEAAFDVIVCRNVLIYFDAETAAATALRLRDALQPGGVVVLGASDQLTLPRSKQPRMTAPPASGAQRPASPRAVPPGATPTPAVPAWSVLDAPTPLGLALAAADAGRLDEALAAITPILAADPLNTVALCVQGLALHVQGDPVGAVHSLRRAVYLDPAFARAAFELGRAHEALGDRQAAERSYRQALEGIEDGLERGSQLGPADEALADACHARLARSAEQVAR